MCNNFFFFEKLIFKFILYAVLNFETCRTLWLLCYGLFGPGVMSTMARVLRGYRVKPFKECDEINPCFLNGKLIFDGE